MLDLESEVLGSILTGGNISLLEFFCFHVVKSLILILALLLLRDKDKGHGV